MANEPLTVAEIFDAFGGPAALGKIIGVSKNHASVMKGRGSIPSKHWPRLIEAARARRIRGVTIDSLAAARQA